MDDTPFTKRPGFYIAGWLIALLVFYGWQILRLGGVQANWLHILFELVCIFPAFLLLWIAFFAQFVLPVRTVADRQKIVHRLLTYFSNRHGPALFIENGIIKEHAGERFKKGPGVVWLDSASAAVTQTATKIKQTMGPGVHFLESGEFFAGVVDLHIQTQSIGPRLSDKPFEEPQEYQSDEEYNQIQYRRKVVSAWTRDGLEVVPNISVSFRMDTGFPKTGQPGSRFGYRTGSTKKDKANEKADQEAIQKAVLGEGINPNVISYSPRSRVAWNQLPAQVAVDVWREYAAKFTFDELFQPNQLVPPPPPPVPEYTEDEVDPFSQPLQVDIGQNLMENSLTIMLRQIIKFMGKVIMWLDDTQKEEPSKPIPLISSSVQHPMRELQKKTATQVINEMVKARLTQPEVDELDDHGVRGTGKVTSAEFKFLQSHGLKVLSVGIGNFRFHPSIEETIINHWSASWLNNVKDENTRIKRKRNILKAAGQEKAIRQYAEELSTNLLSKRPKGAQDTLKTLITQTRGVILENEQLHERLAEDQEVFEQIIKWM